MPKARGWLQIPGVQDGDRSLAEQLKGLEPALAACAGQTVYDFGCAEGLIGIEFGKRGASLVRGCDFVSSMIQIANQQSDQIGLGITCQFYHYNLAGFADAGVPQGFPEQDSVFDIVLALAIVHKLNNPGHVLQNMASLARKRLVLRLPTGSRGEIKYKHGPQRCDSAIVMPAAGFRLEQACTGPRGEIVQHWVRD